MTKYGGDPKTYQLRDMNRRLTSLEAALERSNVRIRNLQDSFSESMKIIGKHIRTSRVPSRALGDLSDQDLPDDIF